MNVSLRTNLESSLAYVKFKKDIYTEAYICTQNISRILRKLVAVFSRKRREGLGVPV